MRILVGQDEPVNEARSSNEDALTRIADSQCMQLALARDVFAAIGAEICRGADRQASNTSETAYVTRRRDQLA